MIYTHPEVAWVGKTEEMLKEEVTEQSEKKVRGWSGDDGIKLLIYSAMSCILINYKDAQATECVDSTTSLNRCKLKQQTRLPLKTLQLCVFRFEVHYYSMLKTFTRCQRYV